MNTDEKKLFKELIAACDTKAFVASDTPLLVSYVQATLMARQTARDPKQIVVWEKSVKLQATLATRLRIAPQSRIDRYTAARQQTYQGPKPWEDYEGPWEIRRNGKRGDADDSEASDET